MRLLIQIALTVLVIVGGLVATNAATIGVRILDQTFSPANVSVNAGDTVIWTNRSFAAHDVTHRASPTLWPSANLNFNQTFAFQFNVAGYYPYYCFRHRVDYPQQTGSVTVASANVAPTVTLTEPANGAVFTAPASFAILADANDANGNLASVEFFLNDVSQGSDTGSPYGVSVNNLAAGTYTIRAVARDQTGASGNSATHTITVNAPNSPPSITLTNPLANATFTAPANFSMGATATDGDGSIASVEFFINGASRGTDNSVPYEISITDLGVGNYTLTARATDNLGGQTTSSGVPITVEQGNAAPVVAAVANRITAPLRRIVFTNSATDADGPVSDLTYSLDGAPTGATIHPTTGVFTWIPRKFQAGTTNVITVRATDKGTPARTGTASFAVVVTDAIELSIGAAPVRRGQTGTVPIYLTSSAFLVGLDFFIDTGTNELSFVTVNSGPIYSAVLQTNENNAQLFLTFSVSGVQTIQGTQQLAELSFVLAGDGPSAFVPLKISGVKPVPITGSITNIYSTDGRIAAIGEEPLLDAKPLAPGGFSSLKLYGIPGESYRVERASVGSAVSDWQSLFFIGGMSGLTHDTGFTTLTNEVTIFRAFRLQP